MTDEVKETPTIDALVERYIKLRDRKQELKAGYEASVANIDAAMTRVEAHLQGTLNDLGAESMRTAFGTVYQSVRTSASCADWDSLLPWIQGGGHWSALEHRVSKSFVEAYKNENNDLPPGVNWSETRTVNIRRS